MKGPCRKCDLGRRGIHECGGETHSIVPVPHPKVLVLVEAPGYDENSNRRPLTGIAGQEARHHLDINGISRFGVRIEHLVRCQPQEKTPPTEEEIRTCTDLNLKKRIQALKPRWVISLGRGPTQFLLGDVNMEMVHGIPRPIEVYGHQTTLIPSYHPAAGLHSPEIMILFHTDLQIAGKVIKSQIPALPPRS